MRQRHATGHGAGLTQETEPFALANADGRIVIPNGPYRRGDTLSEETLEQGIAHGGWSSDWLSDSDGAPFETPRELQFIQRINRLLFFGADRRGDCAGSRGCPVAHTHTSHP